MIPVQFFLRDKMNSGIIIGKIIGHGNNIFPNTLQIRSLCCHHVTLPRMLLPGGKLGIFPRPHLLQSSLHRHSILPRVQHTFNTADGIGMTLADASAPESIVCALRQNTIAQQPLQAEHTRIPTGGDHRHVAAFHSACLTGSKMLGNIAVIIKRIHDIKMLGKLRRLHGQIFCAAAAQDHYIDLIFPIKHVFCLTNRHAGR